jgi:hypothetical protein
VERPDVHPFDDDNGAESPERVDGKATETYRKSHAATTAAQKREQEKGKRIGKGKGKGRAPDEPEVISDSEPDPILEFDESPSSSRHFAGAKPTRTSTPSKTAMPHVRHLAQRFEGPRLDLRVAGDSSKGATIKSSMKPKKVVWLCLDFGI